MLFTKNKPLNILICQSCGGAGAIRFGLCSECHGKHLGMMRRGNFLYWREPLSHHQIVIRKARRYLDKFRIFGAIVFGVGFLLWFFYFIYKFNWWTEIYKLDFWLVGNIYLSLFWLALIIFGYLFYRLTELTKIPGLVEFHGYKEQKVPEMLSEEDTLQNWQTVLHLPRRHRKDISKTFTEEGKLILEEAYLLAVKQHSQEVTVFHLFSTLLSTTKIGTVFLRLGISPQLLQAKLAKFFIKEKNKVTPKLSADFVQILFQAYELAYEVRQEYVNVTELLLATVRQSETLQEILYDLKVDKEKLNNVVAWLRIREKLRRQYQKFSKAAARRSKTGIDRAMTAIATPYLNSFSQDITMAAKFGYLSPCVGREEELAEIFRIIDGGRQSVVLVGEHGVGKMSIVEGLAQKMIEDEVPDRLKDKRLVQLSTSALLAGTTVSGAQERLIHIMHEVSRARNIILFIKNIDDLVGVTETGGEGVDVSETLAEFLGPGKFLTFATATTNNYNQRVLNTELGTVLSRVDIKEMTENQAIQVLQSKVGVVEYKNNVFFSYDALAQCVKLSQRFLHDQNLPESALSIMSEVASFVRQEQGENQLVTADAVGAVISHKTGIPATAVTVAETDRLLRLEQVMHERIIGQDEAVSLVANALRRARVEIRSQNRPIANFLFLGPTGVGKTELAKTIAEVYFGGEKMMVRIDMSEFQDKTGIYRLIGQPGVQGSGLLTEAVRQRSFSLVLLDEMEKADPDVLNLFLQVFDDGRLTDSTGRVIDFTNTIIIATSNAATSFVQEQITQGVSLESIRQQLIRHELKQYYRPEFLNRFDGVVLFKPLGRSEIKQIASLMLKRVAKDLESRGIGLKIEEAGLESLADVGFDPEFGARPMRRAIQDTIENKLAEFILAGKLNRRDVVVVGKNLILTVEKT